MPINWNGEVLTFETPLSKTEQAVYNTFKNSFAEYERERIINLLNENTGCGYEHYESEKCFCDAISLIKGENK